jgi:hypothetical protein
MWQKRRNETQKMMESSRIDREMRRSERERQKESGIQRTVFFVTGSIVLALLFSVHTGLIVIEKVEKSPPKAAAAAPRNRSAEFATISSTANADDQGREEEVKLT